MLFALGAPDDALLDRLAADSAVQRDKIARSALSWSEQPLPGGKHLLHCEGRPALPPSLWTAALRAHLDVRGGEPPAS